MILYDLAGADDAVRYSPYCWRTRLALAHKGLDFETRLWRLTDKAEIAPFSQGLVPVLLDGTTAIDDSWRIACHLEDHYPNHPSLFGGPHGRAHALFINQWYEHAVRPILPRILLLSLLAMAHPRDQAYFRESRTKRFGLGTLEAAVLPLDQGRALFAQALNPVRDALQNQAWLGGHTPSYADHIVFGGLQQARIASIELLADHDTALRDWRERMLDAYDGLARQAQLATPAGH